VNPAKDIADERPDWMQQDELWHSALNAVPLPIFVVDPDMRIMSFNPAARTMLGPMTETVFRRRGGEVFNCIHHTDSAQGCGHGPSCGECVMRNSVTAALQGEEVTQRRTVMEFVRGNSIRQTELMVTASPFAYDGQQLVLLILEDITELSRLRQLLPICANCKKVRNDANYWQSVEQFFTANLNVSFSHGICPDCARKLYPELYERLAKATPHRRQAVSSGPVPRAAHRQHNNTKAV